MVADGNMGIGIENPTLPLEIGGSQGIRIPVGNNDQRSDSPIDGEFRVNSEKETIEVYYSDNWRSVGQLFAPIEASGGDETYIYTDESNVDYKVHAFTTTGSSEFEVINEGSESSIDVLVVGGGGGGAGQGDGTYNPGGGGAGGLVHVQNYEVSPQEYQVEVGKGGEGLTTSGSGGDGETAEKGGDSQFEDLTAKGGGGGGNRDAPGVDGGCGGGNRGRDGDLDPGDSIQTDQSIGTAYGNRGRSGYELENNDGNAGGGGGGAGGKPPTSTSGSRHGGDGGPGLDFSNDFGLDYGENGYFAGGGGGHGDNHNGEGGIGGGGGAENDGSSAESGIPNSGGGGGAASDSSETGGDGGSGIVLIRYPLEKP